MSIRDLLANYVLMMALGLSLGFVSGGIPRYTAEVSMASLGIAMTFSLTDIEVRKLSIRAQARMAGAALFLNFIALSGLILLLGSFFSGDLWKGWVIMAAVPSAVAVIPFTRMLKGDLEVSLFSSTLIYLLCLMLTPGITLLFLGRAVTIEAMVRALVLLILLPLIVSRPLQQVVRNPQTERIAINLCLMVLVFVIMGANRDAFLGDEGLVLSVATVCVIRSFGIGLVADKMMRRLRVVKQKRISLVLFSSYKNLGLGATLAVILFNEAAAIPATIAFVFEILWMVYLQHWAYRG